MNNETSTAVDDLSLETLAAEADELRARINRFRQSLGRFFVDKQALIDLMTVCAIAQEPLLLVGPPGTAKSDLVLRFRDALDLPAEVYFEYMLTRFTEPSEILGPIDINRLREGQYIRRERGKLPTAQLVFLDEIFKSNSAILNTLLTIINERKFYQDGVAEPVALKILFAATNEIPNNAELSALKDRFCLKALCRSVQEDHFIELVHAGLDAQYHRELNQTPWAEGLAGLSDFLKAHRYLSLLMGARSSGNATGTAADNPGDSRDRDIYFKRKELDEFRRIIRTLTREEGVFVSDRKVIKLYRLIRARAWLFHGGVVEKQDLGLLAYLGESLEEIETLEQRVPLMLGM